MLGYYKIINVIVGNKKIVCPKSPFFGRQRFYRIKFSITLINKKIYLISVYNYDSATIKLKIRG